AIRILPRFMCTEAPSLVTDLYGDVRHAFAVLHRVQRAFLETRVPGNDEGGRAHGLVPGIEPRRLAPVLHLLRGLRQPLPRHDNGVVGRNEIFGAAVGDYPDAL